MLVLPGKQGDHEAVVRIVEEHLLKRLHAALAQRITTKAHRRIGQLTHADHQRQRDAALTAERHDGLLEQAVAWRPVIPPERRGLRRCKVDWIDAISALLQEARHFRRGAGLVGRIEQRVNAQRSAEARVAAELWAPVRRLGSVERVVRHHDVLEVRGGEHRVDVLFNAETGEVVANVAQRGSGASARHIETILLEHRQHPTASLAHRRVLDEERAPYLVGLGGTVEREELRRRHMAVAKGLHDQIVICKKVIYAPEQQITTTPGVKVSMDVYYPGPVYDLRNRFRQLSLAQDNHSFRDMQHCNLIYRTGGTNPTAREAPISPGTQPRCAPISPVPQ